MEKTDFSFANGHQQEITSWLWIHFPILAFHPSSLDLCKPLACYHSLRESIRTSVLLDVEDSRITALMCTWTPISSGFYISSISSGSYNLTFLSSAKLSELIAEGSDGDILFKTESSKVFHFLQIVQLWVSCSSVHPLQEQALIG